MIEIAPTAAIRAFNDSQPLTSVVVAASRFSAAVCGKRSFASHHVISVEAPKLK
jgi:hypothetical protein